MGRGEVAGFLKSGSDDELSLASALAARRLCLCGWVEDTRSGNPGRAGFLLSNLSTSRGRGVDMRGDLPSSGSELPPVGFVRLGRGEPPATV